MKSIIIDNLLAARQRSMLVWKAFPVEHHFWKPDEEAMHLLEMVRHIFNAQIWFLHLIKEKGNVAAINITNDNSEYTTLENELQKGQELTNTFHQFINTFSETELETIFIKRTDKDFKMSLRNFLLRAAYHEATHTGQLLSYLRTLHIQRPNIWDAY